MTELDARAAQADVRPGGCGKIPAAILLSAVRPQECVAVSGAVCRYRPMLIAGTPACSYTLTDGTGEIDLLFLGRIEIAGFHRGRRCTAAGMTAVRDDRYVLWNARYWFYDTGTSGRSPDKPASQRDPEVRLPDATSPGMFRMVSTEIDIDRRR